MHLLVSICLAFTLLLQGPALWAREQIERPFERGAATPDSQHDPGCSAIAIATSEERDDDNDDSSPSDVLRSGEAGNSLPGRHAQSGQVAGGSLPSRLRCMHRFGVLTFAPKTGPPSGPA